MRKDYDIAIIGGGLVGLTAALACASKGARIVLLDRDDPAAHLEASFDGRASAIAASSFNMYRHLGIAKALEGHIQPITDILITDGETGQAPSPLTLHFDSQDIGGAPMGYMIENHRLRRALLEATAAHENITIIAPVIIEDINRSPERAAIHVSCEEDIHASLIVAADGRNSFCRRRAGIDVTTMPYDQKAIVTTVEFDKPHHGIAHELFLPKGPFAILPLTGNRASIVWTDSPRAVDAAIALPDEAFTAELARRFGDFLGDVRPCAPRWAYPLSLQMAERYTSERLALIGDAAHAIHPIAGQGLNMGLRDAAALADIAGEALTNGLDVGGASLENYEVWRNFDNSALAGATDILNRFFSNNIGPLKHARRLGLGLVNKISPVRTFFMKEASGQIGDLPSLLR
ncbi:MAG: UbiH/UbiF/VisC/COQ6 family ubiquinone biosynthesis hydroxylase [Alphaproteobacteria bacterium]